MIDLTILILTKNEEYNLPKCIASIGDLPKRIVIVDAGSDDGTAEQAAALAAAGAAHRFLFPSMGRVFRAAELGLYPYGYSDGMDHADGRR